jgi:hypothetical protein
MSDQRNEDRDDEQPASYLPALTRQVGDLVLAGSLQHAEEALSAAADSHGDYAVAEVLATLPPQVTALHLAGFDGAKTSLATLLVPPKAWAESLAYLAATWPDNMIEDDPERIAENLFNHMHGVVYATDDEERRHELLLEASATDYGATAFAILWSLAPREILEVAGEINVRGPHSNIHTTSDSDVVPMALDLARASEDGWQRSLLELFPDYRNAADLADVELPDDPDEESDVNQRGTRELLYRLRKQVPSVRTQPRRTQRRSMGTDIFS